MKLLKQTILFLLFLCSNCLFAQVSSNGLLAYYPFDGNVNDSGPSNFDGTLTGGTFVNDEFNTPNSALELDGISDFVNLSAFATTYRDNTSQLSVYFKIKFIETGNNQTIISLGNSGESLSTNVFEIEYENNQLQVETEVGSATTNYELQIDAANTLFDNQWHEILITFDNTNLKYYKDGSLIFDNTYVPAVTNTTDMFLGAFGGTSVNDCCYAGIQIDELQFYNVILDDSVLSDNTVTENVFSCYPNPVNDIIQIQTKTNYTMIELSISDINGKVFGKYTYNNTNSFNLNIQDLASGIYFLNISANSENKIQEYIKIIKY